MGEHRIEHLATELGARAAARVDPDVTAAAVLERLRRSTRVAWWRRPALQVAAAIALVVGVGVWARGTFSDVDRATAAFVGPVELHELAATELAEVLDSLQTQQPIHELVPVGIHDLEASELRELLERMEG
jgi:hypothetical protein